MLLADMGAEIVQIAAPGRGDGIAKAAMGPMMRGRSRMVLDLKDPAGRELCLAMIEKADALIEGFRPGVMERLGLGPDLCLARNPALVYGRVTGYGQDGPMAQEAGHDPNYLAVAGALATFGYDDRPPVQPLNLVADFGGGGAFLAIGLLAALLNVARTGQGQVIDAAMIDGVAAQMTAIHGMRNAGLWSDRRRSNLLDGAAPFASTYETADGRYLAVCALEDKFYADFLAGLGLAETDLPPRHLTSRWPEARERIAAIVSTRTREEWVAAFAGLQACVTPILDMGEAPVFAHNVARQGFVARDGGHLPAPAPRFSATPSRMSPQDGRPARQVLADWGVPSDPSGLDSPPA
jgi:alpha-methylacyl-CoA racemase